MLPKRRFYLLRHGQTDWNLEGRYQGHSDIPLNATGIAQAAAAAETLAGIPINRIVTRPLIRALKTAATVAERLAKPMHIERGLIERSFGSFDGLVIREVKEKHGLQFDEPSVRILPPDADPWTEIIERAPRVVAQWLARNADETLLFVAHGGIFDALHHHVIGPRTGAESRHATPYVFDCVGEHWTISAI